MNRGVIWALTLLLLANCETQVSDQKPIFSCQGFADEFKLKSVRVEEAKLDSVQLASGSFMYSITGNVSASGADYPFALHYNSNPFLLEQEPVLSVPPLVFDTDQNTDCSLEQNQNGLIEITWISGIQRIFVRSRISGAH
jgi:hypothetical protein